MLNILPGEFKKTQQREYLFRVVALLLIFLVIGLLVASIAMLPAYLVAESERATLAENAAAIEVAGEGQNDVYTVVRATKEKIATLTEEKRSEKIASRIIREVIAARGAGVQIMSIAYDDTAGSVRLEGVASTRAALVTYERTLEDLPLFAEAALPIGDLTKSERIPFSLDMVLAEDR